MRRGSPRATKVGLSPAPKTALAAGAGFLAALIVVNLIGVGKTLVYVVLGTGLWLALLQSGVHATIAGVLLAFTVPAASFINAHIIPVNGGHA